MSAAGDAGAPSAPYAPDLPTVVAVAVVAFALAAVVHEGLGHGGACLAVGCAPRMMTTMQFQGDEAGLGETAGRIIAAGGTIANVAAAALAAYWLRRRRDAVGPAWLFGWLFATVNALQAAGYPLYSGFTGIGDWASVVDGWSPAWLWRVGLVAVGAATYWLAVSKAMNGLGARLPGIGRRRVGPAYRYCLAAYLAGGILDVASGWHEPGGLFILLISGIASSFGGTSGLAWGPQLLNDPATAPAGLALPPIGRDRRWIAAAVVVGAVFILVLGPGVALR
ncbi:MAG: hypothetical protein U0470_02240 [Anaerolineae bacterium]